MLSTKKKCAIKNKQIFKKDTLTPDKIAVEGNAL